MFTTDEMDVVGAVAVAAPQIPDVVVVAEQQLPGAVVAVPCARSNMTRDNLFHSIHADVYAYNVLFSSHGPEHQQLQRKKP